MPAPWPIIAGKKESTVIAQTRTIGIVGGGAMGTLTAALFSLAGFRVVIYERDPTRAAALARGYTLIRDDERIPIALPVSADPAILAGADPLFFFVKSYDTETAARSIDDRAAATATMVTLQNGIGNDAILAGRFGRAAIVYGTTTMGAALAGPDQVRFGGSGTTVIGGDDPARVGDIARILGTAGMAVSTTDAPEGAVWEKVVVNAGINPLAALLGVTNGFLADHEHARMVQEKLVREAVAAAAAVRGISLDADALVAKTLQVCRATAINRCSMLQDLERGTPTEIESITGAIVSAARERGVAVPVNETMLHLIRAREAAAREKMHPELCPHR